MPEMTDHEALQWAVDEIAKLKSQCDALHGRIAGQRFATRLLIGRLASDPRKLHQSWAALSAAADAAAALSANAPAEGKAVHEGVADELKDLCDLFGEDSEDGVPPPLLRIIPGGRK